MKIFLTTLLVLVVLGALGYGGWFFFLRTPQASPPLGTQEPVVFPSATDTAAAESDFHNDLPQSDSLRLTNMIVLEPYALADWSDQNIGGMVVFKRDAKGDWQILVMDGGVLEVRNLVEAGVPESIAKSLIETNRY
jgi:hypothetical protein